jgi:CTP:molybdopterin cytidylyltransferase MocA
MGRPKALSVVDGVPLIEAHAAALARCGARPVIVLGATEDQIRRAVRTPADIVVNPRWAQQGMSDSLAHAIREADIHGLCLVTPVDVPPVTPETLAALIAVGGPAVPVGPDGARGHPVLIDAAIARRLLAGPVPGGLRTLLVNARTVQVAQADVALDFDDPAALASWRASRLTSRAG